MSDHLGAENPPTMEDDSEMTHKPAPMLDGLLAGFAARGWDPADAGRFRMEVTDEHRVTPETFRTLMGEAQTLAGDVRALRNAKPEERSATWADDLKAKAILLRAVDAEAAVAERALGLEARITPGANGPSAAFTATTPPEYRSAGDVFANDPAVRAHIGATGGKGTSPEVEVRTLLTSSTADTPAAGVLLPKGQPELGNVRQRRLFIRDLLPGGTTTLSSIPYVRELNPATNETGVTSVAEGGTKPEVQAQFVPQDAPVRKIAGWIPATEEILADAPTLRSYIDARLAYMVLLREEEQVLNGSGSGADLRGIRQTVGLQTQTAVAGDFSATLGRAIGKIETVDGEADGIALNPTDFWTMVTTRFANQFDGEAIGGSPFGAPPRTVWGLPAARTRSMASGTSLVGAFGMGAQLFTRQGVTIKTSDSHSTFFVENKIVVLAEERVALAVYRPDWFVETTLA